MFKNEFIPIKGNIQIENGMEKMIKFAIKLKMVKKLQDGYTKTEDKVGSQRIEFCKNLLQSYIDSYHIVAETIYSLKENSVVIEQQKLVNYLHQSI
jgi:hypothetical protein